MRPRVQTPMYASRTVSNGDVTIEVGLTSFLDCVFRDLLLFSLLSTVPGTYVEQLVLVVRSFADRNGSLFLSQSYCTVV